MTGLGNSPEKYAEALKNYRENGKVNTFKGPYSQPFFIDEHPSSVDPEEKRRQDEKISRLYKRRKPPKILFRRKFEKLPNIPANLAWPKDSNNGNGSSNKTSKGYIENSELYSLFNNEGPEELALFPE